MNEQPDEHQEEGTATAPQAPAATISAIEDDFGDEQLGERQPLACSMDEGCIVCQ
jgi:hypothetical protein